MKKRIRTYSRAEYLQLLHVTGVTSIKDLPEYNAWAGMVQRCTRKKTKSYPHYGGRGIKVCDAWRHSFVQFYADVGPRPSASHSLGRKDNNGNYEPQNVRWMSLEDQNNNTRQNRYLTYKGRRMTVAQWARELSVNEMTLYSRLHMGWSSVKTLTTPVQARHRR